MHIEKIIEIMFVDCLNNLYVTSNSKKIKVLDMQSYEEIQELDFHDLKRFGEVNFCYMSSIDF